MTEQALEIGVGWTYKLLFLYPDPSRPLDVAVEHLSLRDVPLRVVALADLLSSSDP